MSITEVLAAFLVLMIAAGGFTVCLNSAMKQMDHAGAVRETAFAIAKENAGDDYKNASAEDQPSGTYRFKFGGLKEIPVKVRGAVSGNGAGVFLPPVE